MWQLVLLLATCNFYPSTKMWIWTTNMFFHEKLQYQKSIKSSYIYTGNSHYSSLFVLRSRIRGPQAIWWLAQCSLSSASQIMEECMCPELVDLLWNAWKFRTAVMVVCLILNQPQRSQRHPWLSSIPTLPFLRITSKHARIFSACFLSPYCSQPGLFEARHNWPFSHISSIEARLYLATLGVWVLE